MGFHTRHLSRNIIIEAYEKNGINGVKNLTKGADALDCDGDSGRVFDKERTEEEIAQIILNWIADDSRLIES